MNGVIVNIFTAKSLRISIYLLSTDPKNRIVKQYKYFQGSFGSIAKLPSRNVIVVFHMISFAFIFSWCKFTGHKAHCAALTSFLTSRVPERTEALQSGFQSTLLIWSQSLFSLRSSYLFLHMCACHSEERACAFTFYTYMPLFLGYVLFRLFLLLE